MEKINCYSCGNSEFQESNLHTKRKILICKTCGAAMFDISDTDEEKIKNYYRFEYRPNPDYNNLLTTTVKQNFIAKFLADFIKDKKGLICGDVGCATGYVPNFLRRMGHKATGCEYTLAYRRMAEHYYGIPITEELETKHKYDLITIYHVLEHMINPFEKLVKYKEMLSDNGRIMISVPRWFHYVDEPSGGGIVNFENFFHKDHINLFSRESLLNLFRRVGLKVEKEDQITYGQTFLLSKCEPETIIMGDWNHTLDVLIKNKQALDLFEQKEYSKAIEIWPNFPEAHCRMLMETYVKDEDRQIDYIQHVNDNMPEVAESVRWRGVVAIWNYQHARITEAFNMFSEIANIAPRSDYFAFMGFCAERMGKYQEAMFYFDKCATLNPIRWAEMMNLMLNCACKIPTWDERAITNIKEKLYEQNKESFNLSPNDSMMK